MSYGSPPAGDFQTPYGPAPQQHGSAVTALVLGIASLAFCALLGPPAYIIGRRAEEEIRASGGTLSGEGLARAGWVCGLSGMILLGVFVLLFIGMFVFSGAMMFGLPG